MKAKLVNLTFSYSVKNKVLRMHDGPTHIIKDGETKAYPEDEAMLLLEQYPFNFKVAGEDSSNSSIESFHSHLTENSGKILSEDVGKKKDLPDDFDLEEFKKEVREQIIAEETQTIIDEIRGTLVAEEIEAANKQVEKLIKEASEKAEQIIKDAKEDAAIIINKAKEEVKTAKKNASKTASKK